MTRWKAVGVLWWSPLRWVKPTFWPITSGWTRGPSLNRVPEKLWGALEQEVWAVLALHVIEESQCLSCSLVLLVPKPDGTMCGFQGLECNLTIWCLSRALSWRSVWKSKVYYDIQFDQGVWVNIPNSWLPGKNNFCNPLGFYNHALRIAWGTAHCSKPNGSHT